MALLSCFNKSNLELIKDMELKIGGENIYSDIFTLFESLKKINGMSTINIRSFIEEYVKMYGEASLISIDYLPCFLQMIFSSIVGGNIYKDYIIESLIEKFSNKMYNTFISLI
jgi:hypothetical protein